LESDWTEFCATDFKGADFAIQFTAGLEPVGLAYEKGGVADGLSRGGVGDCFEGEGAFLPAGESDRVKRADGNAHEILRVAVEQVDGQGAIFCVAEKFEITSVVAEFEECAAVGCLVSVAFDFARVIVVRFTARERGQRESAKQ